MKNVTLATIASLILMTHCSAQNITQVVSPQTNIMTSDHVIAADNTATAGLGDDIDITTIKPGKPKRQVPWFVDRFKIAAGLFLASNNTDIAVNNTSGTKGTNIDFENDLGLNKISESFLADFQWRASSRSRFDLSYYGLYRNSNHTLQRDVTFGDHTYNVNADVNAFFNTDIYRFSYGYAIFSKPKFELGLLFGLHIVKASMGIGINGANLSAAANDDFGFTAPLPDFGIWGGYAFGRRWSINGEFDYLSLTIDNIAGQILAYNISGSYRVLDNLTVSLGCTGFNAKVDVTRDKLDGHLKWGYNGPSLTAAFSFGRKGWL